MTVSHDTVFLLDVDNTLLIYIHKELMLDAVQQHYPARHYVMVDDKLRILAAMKGVMQSRLTTVFPRQGHYALDLAAIAAYPPADIAVERIGDLLQLDVRDFRNMGDLRHMVAPKETP